jgi:thiol:disulfide interchange protein
VNGRLWGGLLLSLVAAFSYPLFFVRFPITRDVPWVNILLFLFAFFLLITGFRRAQRKIAAGIVVALGIGIGALFGVGLVVGSKAPASPDAPRAGQKAPEFALLDSTRRERPLSQLLASSPRGVLLIFYRGHW